MSPHSTATEAIPTYIQTSQSQKGVANELGHALYPNDGPNVTRAGLWAVYERSSMNASINTCQTAPY